MTSDTISAADRRVLDLLSKGATKARVAQDLDVTLRELRESRARIRHAFGVATDIQAVVAAARQSLI